MKTTPTRQAAEALNNLGVFAIVENIMDGSFVYGGSNPAARKIVAICKAEQQRQLRLYDNANAKVPV